LFRNINFGHQEKMRNLGPVFRGLGPFGFQYVFSGIEACRFVLSSRWRDLHSGGAWPRNFQELLGDNIVFQDGSRHDRLRRLLLPAFHGAAARSYPPSMCRIVNSFLDR
jgi:retinoid hydroxylase